MQYVRLGGSGLKVAELCMGTMTFGREADEEMSFKMLDYYVEQGGNFVDTADVYSNGVSEEIVGRWLQSRRIRDQMIIATKVYGTMGPGPNDGGLSRLHIQRAVEDSLRRLQIDVIDIYQIHRWDPETPVEETLEALHHLILQGKVRYIGCSNLRAWHLAKFLHYSDSAHLSRFVCIQPIYNALNRSIENDILPYAAAEGLGVITYNPLAGGMLTGKYRRNAEMPKGARLEAFKMYYNRYYTDESFDIVERFVSFAEEKGVSPAQLAIAWVMSEPRVTCPILGARNTDQLRDSMAAVHIRLSPEERAEIPAIRSGRWVGIDQTYDREEA